MSYFLKKIHASIDSLQVQINSMKDDIHGLKDDMHELSQGMDRMYDRVTDKVYSLDRRICYHDHARISYANPNNSFYGGCFIYKDGDEYLIRGLQLRGKVDFYIQQSPAFDYVLMATCEIPANDEEEGHEEQYVIDLNQLSFIRTE